MKFVLVVVLIFVLLIVFVVGMVLSILVLIVDEKCEDGLVWDKDIKECVEFFEFI